LKKKLGCKSEGLPTTYLGMPQHKALDIWDGILEKEERMFARLKEKCLSTGGRVILINYVLDFVQTMLSPYSQFLQKGIKKLDMLRRNFLWRGGK